MQQDQARKRVTENRWHVGEAALDFYYHELDETILILRADGGMNADNAGQFVGDLEKLVDAGIRKIIVDCSGLGHISSFGIGVLLRVRKRLARPQMSTALCCLRTRRMFDQQGAAAYIS